MTPNHLALFGAPRTKVSKQNYRCLKRIFSKPTFQVYFSVIIFVACYTLTSIFI